MDQPKILGFAVLEWSKLLLHETFYEKLQPYSGRENLKLHYMDCGSFVSSNKSQDNIFDLKNFEYLNDFSNLDENHELFSNKNKKIVGFIKTKTPKSFWIRNS